MSPASSFRSNTSDEKNENVASQISLQNIINGGEIGDYNSDNSSDVNFIDDEAEQGEEDTRSKNSNQLIDTSMVSVKKNGKGTKQFKYLDQLKHKTKGEIDQEILEGVFLSIYELFAFTFLNICIQINIFVFPQFVKY